MEKIRIFFSNKSYHIPWLLPRIKRENSQTDKKLFFQCSGSDLLLNSVTTRKGVEGKANKILQVLRPNVSTEELRSWWCRGKG